MLSRTTLALTSDNHAKHPFLVLSLTQKAALVSVPKSIAGCRDILAAQKPRNNLSSWSSYVFQRVAFHFTRTNYIQLVINTLSSPTWHESGIAVWMVQCPPVNRDTDSTRTLEGFHVQRVMAISKRLPEGRGLSTRSCFVLVAALSVHVSCYYHTYSTLTACLLTGSSHYCLSGLFKASDNELDRISSLSSTPRLQ